MLNIELSTIIFQIINFLILLVVLTRFLYQPVMRTVRQRQEEIAARLRDADQRTADADAERERLRHAIEDANLQAEQLLFRARADASIERARLIDGARNDAARYREEAQRAMQELEREELARLETRIRATAVTMAGSLIRQAAGPAVHRGLLDRLLDGGIHADGLVEHLTGHLPGPVVVELAYAPDAELQDDLRMAFADQSVDVEFRVNDDLLAGARIVVGQQAVVDLSLQRTLADLQSEPVA
ncbi:MAG TPA: F0F1 ATP synthase subunit delta [Chloroflexota bacterium]|jgi:F-type H+-transporting ATPase subunit b